MGHALTLQSGNEYEFQMYTAIPVTTNGWYLQGEIEKWITVSQQRFKQMTRSEDGSLSVTIKGAVGENVKIAFVNVMNETMTQTIINCLFDESLQLIIKMP